jgi:NAD(P)-dependent dehydrogenase (short-subunit alcohol dehydrogenase family)
MRAQGGGRIVNISSGTPFRGVPFLLHYVTSKGAIVALTRALAKELGATTCSSTASRPGSR